MQYIKVMYRQLRLYILLFFRVLYYLFLSTFFQRSLFLRQKLEGNPAIISRNGQIDFEQLKKCRINLNHLQSLLRQSEVFSIREVAYALIEPNGEMSILKKSAYQKLTQEDIQLPNQAVHLPVTIILDGKLLKKKLQEIHKDEQWLSRELKTKGIENAKDVLLAEWLEDDGLFVIEKKATNKLKKPNPKPMPEFDFSIFRCHP